MKTMESDYSMKLTPELKVHPLSGGDSSGVVFVGNGRIYRGISAEACADTLELFDRGIIDELVQKRLIPKTWICEINLPHFPVVLEQEYIPCLTYSYEWTFGMLRDAGELVLDLRGVLNKYEYDLKDAHPDNIVFEKAKPYWVDIGSFIRNNDPDHWIAETRYRQSYVYPLQIWSVHGDAFGRRILLGGDYIPIESAVIAVLPWTRFLSNSLKKILRAKEIYANLYHVTGSQFRQKTAKISWLNALFSRCLRLERYCYKFLTSKRLPYRRTSMSKIRTKLRKIREPNIGSKWKDYHAGVLREVGAVETYPRFQKVIDILNQLRPATVTEIGANQGLLSKLILEYVSPEHVIAIDIDGDALECYYQVNRRSTANAYHAVLDVNRPVTQVPKQLPEERLKSEAVVALAVTHHMIITQCNSAQHVLQRIACFANKWLLIEYMPYGLYAEPVECRPPVSYSAETFEAAFNEIAEIVGVYKLEPTRILYVGKKKS